MGAGGKQGGGGEDDGGELHFELRCVDLDEEAGGLKDVGVYKCEYEVGCLSLEIFLSEVKSKSVYIAFGPSVLRVISMRDACLYDILARIVMGGAMLFHKMEKLAEPTDRLCDPSKQFSRSCFVASDSALCWTHKYETQDPAAAGSLVWYEA